MKHKTEWTIGTIIAILGLLVAAGFFHSPNIILVRQSASDYTCPNTLYSNFNVMFSNKGSADTSLCVSLSSPNENITFEKESDCLYADTGEQTQFTLEINESSLSNLNNVTINYNYLYTKFFIKQNHTISCEYAKEGNWQLVLQSQKTLY